MATVARQMTTATRGLRATSLSLGIYSDFSSGRMEIQEPGLAGEIETGSDVDYFSVQVGESGTLMVYTTGFLNTQGQLESSSGSILTSNDDGGTDY